MCEFTTGSGMIPPSSRRVELERQLDELKRIEEEEIPCDLMRDKDGKLVNARGLLDDDGNVIDD